MISCNSVYDAALSNFVQVWEEGLESKRKQMKVSVFEDRNVKREKGNRIIKVKDLQERH